MSVHQSSAVRFGISLCILPSALIGCASSGTPIDHDIDLVVSPSIVAVLASHKPRLPAPAELAALDSTVTIDHKANLGQIDTSEQRQVFLWQVNGQLSSTSVGTFRSPNGTVSTWTATSTTICGLVPVLIESASKTNSQATTAVPVGGVFVPFGFSSKSQAASRSRLVAFSSSTTNLCSPSAGASFTFQFVREEQRKFEGSMHSSNKLHTITYSAACTVGATELPATTLNTSFAGKYLPVSCSYSDPAKQSRKSEFAYLVDSGIYIPVSVQLSEYQTNTTRYTALKYK